MGGDLRYLREFQDADRLVLRDYLYHLYMPQDDLCLGLKFVQQTGNPL